MSEGEDTSKTGGTTTSGTTGLMGAFGVDPFSFTDFTNALKNDGFNITIYKTETETETKWGIKGEDLSNNLGIVFKSIFGNKPYVISDAIMNDLNDEITKSINNMVKATDNSYTNEDNYELVLKLLYKDHIMNETTIGNSVTNKNVLKLGFTKDKNIKYPKIIIKFNDGDNHTLTGVSFIPDTDAGGNKDINFVQKGGQKGGAFEYKSPIEVKIEFAITKTTPAQAPAEGEGGDAGVGGGEGVQAEPADGVEGGDGGAAVGGDGVDAGVGDGGVGDAGVGDAGVGDAGVGDAGVGDAGVGGDGEGGGTAVEAVEAGAGEDAGAAAPAEGEGGEGVGTAEPAPAGTVEAQAVGEDGEAEEGGDDEGDSPAPEGETTPAAEAEAEALAPAPAPAPAETETETETETAEGGEAEASVEGVEAESTPTEQTIAEAEAEPAEPAEEKLNDKINELKQIINDLKKEIRLGEEADEEHEKIINDLLIKREKIIKYLMLQKHKLLNEATEANLAARQAAEHAKLLEEQLTTEQSSTITEKLTNELEVAKQSEQEAEQIAEEAVEMAEQVNEALQEKVKYIEELEEQIKKLKDQSSSTTPEHINPLELREIMKKLNTMESKIENIELSNANTPSNSFAGMMDIDPIIVNAAYSKLLYLQKYAASEKAQNIIAQQAEGAETGEGNKFMQGVKNGLNRLNIFKNQTQTETGDQTAEPVETEPPVGGDDGKRDDGEGEEDPAQARAEAAQASTNSAAAREAAQAQTGDVEGGEGGEGGGEPEEPGQTGEAEAEATAETEDTAPAEREAEESDL